MQSSEADEGILVPGWFLQDVFKMYRMPSGVPQGPEEHPIQLASENVLVIEMKHPSARMKL